LNANRQSDSFTALEVALYNSNHIPGGTSAQISARHAQDS
jgi:Cft2 family RNA processing exonuclease